MNLDSWKACQDSDIPEVTMKSNQDIFTDTVYSEFNSPLGASVFPPTVKLRTVHKKGNRSEKENCWLVSILTNLSKIFERCIYN